MAITVVEGDWADVRRIPTGNGEARDVLGQALRQRNLPHAERLTQARPAHQAEEMNARVLEERSCGQVIWSRICSIWSSVCAFFGYGPPPVEQTAQRVDSCFSEANVHKGVSYLGFSASGVLTGVGIALVFIATKEVAIPVLVCAGVGFLVSGAYYYFVNSQTGLLSLKETSDDIRGTSGELKGTSGELKGTSDKYREVLGKMNLLFQEFGINCNEYFQGQQVIGSAMIDALRHSFEERDRQLKEIEREKGLLSDENARLASYSESIQEEVRILHELVSKMQNCGAVLDSLGQWCNQFSTSELEDSRVTQENPEHRALQDTNATLQLQISTLAESIGALEPISAALAKLDLNEQYRLLADYDHRIRKATENLAQTVSQSNLLIQNLQYALEQLRRFSEGMTDRMSREMKTDSEGFVNRVRAEILSIVDSLQTGNTTSVLSQGSIEEIAT
ncbi:MAG: hypothetical protein S4CHLAM45_01040 [Chlamydiales bacterium]|nr:hypothetical protein [Chlamydiales bacterium]